MESINGMDSKVFDLWVQRLAEEGLSLEAIDTTNGNKRVGAYLCSAYRKDTPHPIDVEIESMEQDDQIKSLCDILHEPLDVVRSEIHDRHKKDAYFEGIFLSVLSEYCGQGIGARLIKAAEDKAREINIHAIYVCATSNYTAAAVAKQGYEGVYTLPYDKYEKDGKRIYYPKHPHVALQSFVKVVDDREI